MTKQIELVTNFETGEKETFFLPAHIKGSVALDGLELGKEMQKKGDDVGRKDFEKIADFVAKRLYNGQFTRDQLIDGLNATDVFTELMNQLSAVLGSQDSENFTPEKKS